MAKMDGSDVGNSSASGHKEDGSLGISVSNFVWIYVAPIILLVGVVGNCLTIAVMRRKRLRGGTVAIYLVLIAIADTCFLVIGIIPEWLEAMEIIVFKKIHPATCKVEKFFGYSAGDIAIWLLVVFTFDRFVAVCFPLKKSEVCTTRRAWILVGFCVVLAIAKNLHVFWTRGAEYIVENGKEVLKSNCGRPTPEYKHFENYIRPWIAFTLISVVPCCLISTFNVGIVRTLLKMPQAHKATESTSTKMERKFSQATLMCVSVSVLFLVTITPSIVLLIGRPYWDDDAQNPNYAYLTAKGLNNALVFMNHSLNFFLYCLTGKRFREQFLLMFQSTCCGIYPDGFTARSTAHTASLYIKSIHKLSRDIISSAARTDETTAGTSVRNGTTSPTDPTLRTAAWSAARMKRDKSKQSVKSLDSESSFSHDMIVIPLREIPPVCNAVTSVGSDTTTATTGGGPAPMESKLPLGNPSRSCQGDSQEVVEHQSPTWGGDAAEAAGGFPQDGTYQESNVIKNNSNPQGSSIHSLAGQPSLHKPDHQGDIKSQTYSQTEDSETTVGQSDSQPTSRFSMNGPTFQQDEYVQRKDSTAPLDPSLADQLKESHVIGNVDFPCEGGHNLRADRCQLCDTPGGDQSDGGDQAGHVESPGLLSSLNNPNCENGGERSTEPVNGGCEPSRTTETPPTAHAVSIRAMTSSDESET